MVRVLQTLALFAALTGCASIPGVAASSAELAQCNAEGCTVWTQKELNIFFKNAFTLGAEKGYDAGYKAGVKSL